MHRRTLLRGLTAAGSTLAVAGCLRRGYEEDALRIQNTAIEETDDGYLSLAVTVSNIADRAVSGTLYVNSSMQETPRTRVRKVTIDAYTTTTVRVTYDVKFEDVTNFQPTTDLVEE
ncbi:hypothetical protein [Halobacterium zhouii]|uniref:hypothetical protein n=1 Tax=Halobacterium zhouii TaxID=2902624 RepID=UPI001E5C8F01|nr:hypothetical protein [Halobacterium zhouii]